MTSDRTADLPELYRRMCVVRETETRLGELFRNSEIPGFIHLSIGQEAVAVGICSALRLSDTLASNHRGHGHAIAKGMALDSFFLEVMGKAEGACRGRGGSMHVADMATGMLGANGIVGAGIPIALGSALAHQRKGQGDIAVAFFGDGALAEGVLHECLNLAALWQLPLMLVCENNGWSEFSPTPRQFVAKPCRLAEVFGIPTATVDGNDVVAVSVAAKKLVAAARSGEGPQFLECVTHRVGGHYEGDAQKYRDVADIDEAVKRDPLAAAEDMLRKAGKAAGIDTARAEAAESVEAAIVAGRGGSMPIFSAAMDDVYTAKPSMTHA